MLKYLPKDTLSQWALGSVAVAGAASVAYVLVFSEDATVPPPPQLNLIEPPALAAPAPEPPPDVQIAMAATVSDLAPRFDLVRVTDLGDMLIAGQAPATSAVAALIDEDPVAQTVSSSAGEFVLMFQLASSPVPRVLELEVRLPSGDRVRSLDTLMLAPGSGISTDVSDTPLQPRSMGREVAVAPLFPALEQAPEPAPGPGQAGGLAGGLAAPAAEAGAGMPLVPPAPDLPRPAPTAMLMRADGSVQMLGEAPGLPQRADRVSLDALSYDAEGAVGLAGRASTGGADLQIYLDNQPILRARAAADGNWQAQLDGIERGVYRLRIDEIDASAKVTSRVEIPFAREAPEIAREASGPEALIVQPGNTLWRMSQDRFGDGARYMRIFDANRDQIRNPNLIYPGQVILLPDSPD